MLFLIAAALAAIGALATNLLSPRPACACTHAQGLARLGVFAGCVASIARVLSGGQVSTDSIVILVSLAVLYLLQAKSETKRQTRLGRR